MQELLDVYKRQLMMLSMVFVMVSMSAASARRIAEVLNEKADITNPKAPVMEVPDGRIDFNHVDFVYKKDSETDTLHDICLLYTSRYQ